MSTQKIENLGKIALVIILYSITAAIVIAMGLGMWQLAREVNYSFGYESQVKETICEMVRPENLKHPCN